jgi:hypothetical protein
MKFLRDMEEDVATVFIKLPFVIQALYAVLMGDGIKEGIYFCRVSAHAPHILPPRCCRATRTVGEESR